MFKTFVINLDKDTKRMQFMHYQLSNLNIEYCRIPAILGKEYKPSHTEYNEELAIKKGGHKMLLGEIGCALSHAKVIESIVSEKIPYSLILEDDISIPYNFKEIIEREIKKNEINKKWEYLLFDYVEVGKPYIRQWLTGVKNTLKNLWQINIFKAMVYSLYFFIKGLYIIPLSIFEGMRERYMKNHPGSVQFFRPVYFAGAYLVSLSGAEKLYSLTKPVVYTADQLPNKARFLRGLKFRGYAPQSVYQQKQQFGSSILDLDGSEI